MSEPKLISPLLDGFAMGNTISEHDGVRCCPAIKEHTDKKYIVKIISIPATQTQMDALLLAGAYKDPADAMDYFKEIGEGVMKEAELLKKLSRLDGYLPYEGWQMEPITRRRLGYEVYLIGSYKRSLDKHVRRHPVTHLEAVNLGLDLCSALAVCREAGALYVDLKPTNIFVSEKKEYRIGDLGFIQLDALSYTAMPDKYRSVYTPPELFDPMAALNLTVDTYAVGMILYQLYNDGQLPFKEKMPEEGLPSPVNADYELAEIIMKAIHPDPEQRWNDPKELGKALASYMQRNTVNDVPITPHTPLVVDPKDVIVPAKKKSEPDPKPASEPAAENAPSEETSEEAPAAEDSSAEAAAAEEEVSVEEAVSEEPSEEASAEKETEAAPVEEESSPVKAVSDELQPEEMSDELLKIMTKADDLIAHETPEGVVLPEIPDLPDPFAFVTEDSDEIDDSDIPLDPVMEDEEEPQAKKKKKREKKFLSPNGKHRMKKFFSTVFFLLILIAMGLAAFWYYQNIYLQTIDSISIDGDKHQLTVTIDSKVDEELLRVTCSDHYGNVETQSLVEGKAVFTDLVPNTMYTIQLEIDGFHALVGQTSDVYTTDATTNIVSFTSVTGAEDGSVMLNFTVDGEEPREWAVVYSAEGEEEQREVFLGHSVTISDLSVGKIYTFTLDAGSNLSLSGETTLEFMASRLILAEDLTITSSTGSDMTVRWNAPGDIVVDSWDVRCYNDSGYEEQLTVTETEVYFTGIDLTDSYTVEVTASGMTQPARTSITANPIIISEWNVDDSDANKLAVTWKSTGSEPDGGWLFMYTIDGNSRKEVIKCDDASAVIEPRIPGAKYEFTIQTADGTSVFSNVHSYTCPDAQSFDKHSLTADKLTVDLLKTPKKADWRYESIRDEDLTDTFASGDSISIVLRSSSAFYTPGAELDMLYVIRDAHGNVIPDLVSQDSGYWKDVWAGGSSQNGELDLPKAPTAAGEYVLNIYFDGMAVAEVSFTITE